MKFLLIFSILIQLAFCEVPDYYIKIENKISESNEQLVRDERLVKFKFSAIYKL